jgi:hypothetical protein
VDAIAVSKNLGKPMNTVYEFWRSVDGRQTADRSSGSLSVQREDNEYAVLVGLPTDPDRALAEVKAYVAQPQRLGTPDTPAEVPEAINAAAYVLIQTALTEMYLPPAVTAVLFRTLALLPGVFVKPGVVDADGHPATAIARKMYNVELDETLLDPNTYRVFGTEYDLATDLTIHDPTGRAISEKAGTVEGWHFVQAVRVVDAPGKTS